MGKLECFGCGHRGNDDDFANEQGIWQCPECGSLNVGVADESDFVGDLGEGE